MRLLAIAGTRPEAIKLAPVAAAAARRPGIVFQTIATGQHEDLFTRAADSFDLAISGNLGLLVPGQSHEALAAAIAGAMPALIEQYCPDLLIVQGDTTSAWAAALAAHRLGVPIGHVEAGLRSGDPLLPWPEERNRIEIDAIASLLFAPGEGARQNLAAEPAVRGLVHVTGNTGIDALLAMRGRLGGWTRHDSARRMILVTCHRHENLGRLNEICAAIAVIARRGDVTIRWPLHLNPGVHAPVRAALGHVRNIALLPPVSYAEMLRLMERAFLILSDSGGLQEEAPALGVPLLVLRDNSERPEAIACGNARLIGTQRARIVEETLRLLDDPVAHAAMATPAFPYGRGDAAERILDAIEIWHAARARSSAIRPQSPPRLPSARLPRKGAAAKG